jgi:hypothetical protein
MVATIQMVVKLHGVQFADINKELTFLLLVKSDYILFIQ